MSILGAIRRVFSRSPLMAEMRPIHARYDAAQSTGSNVNHWSATDALNADSANSLAVRKKLRERARYEVNNNGHAKGIVSTQANYVVGRGPKLRMGTKSPGMNAMVEAAWNRWAISVGLNRKLRTAVKAKVTDGEAFLLAKNNPSVSDVVKLDIVPIECDQVTSLYATVVDPNQIDGVRFDDFGNPLTYDILRYHPGAQWAYTKIQSDVIDARYVCHLFREDRPGQHRGVPEITATLGLFAQARRYREATVAAAENIANFSILVKTAASPDTGPDQLNPFDTLPISKGMMVALPNGGDAFQPKAEQPTATYDAFNRSIVCEEARPLNMPYNIAACDSSGYSFSGGRLDHLTYFVSVEVEQSEIEAAILDKVFALWFAEAKLEYDWGFEANPPPPHAWDWPARPQIDDSKTASARQTDLSTGVRSLSEIYAEDGKDFEDGIQTLAADYGKTVDEMREILLKVNFAKSSASAPAQDQSEDGNEDDTPPKNGNGKPVNRFARNGNGATK